MFGWCGKIARINLSDHTIVVDALDSTLLTRFIGGRGLAGYFLQEHVTRGWDDPSMPLLLFAGPLVNTTSPTSGRMTVMSRSPLTGTIGDASVGGAFGTALKRAGLDGIIITGKSDRLCGVEIEDHAVRVVPATRLAGRETGSVNTLLKGKGATAVIGPAAENGVRFASVIFDGHYAAGRNGLGLVFASKNLKYLTVTGTGKTAIFDPKALKTAAGDIYRLVAASPALLGEFGISRFGTGALYDLIDARGMMPTDNFRKTRFKGARSVNAHAFKKKYNPISTGCRGCHIRCKKVTNQGISMPEFETMSHFSALIGNSDIRSVTEANRICNETGMDTISAAATLACHSEIFKKRLGPGEVVSLLHDIAGKRGEGIALGKGAARYAKECGRPDLAMTVKDQELPAYDPRGAYGMALAYATSSRGACHLRAYPISHEILRKPVATDRFTFSGKARIIKIAEDLNAVVDSLTACKFIFFAVSLEEYAAVYAAVTGIKTTGNDLYGIGERIYYNERIMNAANGFTDIHDDLPSRFFNTPGYEDNNIKTRPISREDFLTARSDYYTVRGLDQTGKPTMEKTRALGLLKDS